MRMVARDKRLLAIAIGSSLLFHAALLSLRFVPPQALRAAPFDPGLAVILVNARHDSAPLKADALAQANLDGGGNADAGRMRSPLPDLGRLHDGEQFERRQRRVAELEQMQRRLLARTAQPQPDAVDAGKDADRPAIDGRDVRSVEEIQEIARRQAEIARDIADYGKRPLKFRLTPSTREVPHALYYTALQKKIEQTGTLNFPQQDGRKMYGELIVSIPVAEDGSLYDREGGPRVERSSGNAALDAAALAIVRRAAPFGRFPSTLARDGRARVWEIIARFSFTREQTLQTQSLGKAD
jgi:protein TonB